MNVARAIHEPVKFYDIFNLFENSTGISKNNRIEYAGALIISMDIVLYSQLEFRESNERA